MFGDIAGAGFCIAGEFAGSMPPRPACDVGIVCEVVRAMKYVITFIAGAVFIIILPLVIIGLGGYNVSAATGPGPFEAAIAPWAMERSVSSRAPDISVPLVGNPGAISEGMDHFKESCVLCHGAPGVHPAEFAEGLEPKAPELSGSLKDMSDGEMYWIIKNGIRMSAMPAFGPTHSDTKIQQMIAFIHHLPDLTPQEKATLAAATTEKHEHGEEGHEGKGGTASADAGSHG